MNQFLAQLHDVFAPLGEIRTRAMFGGHGVYHDGLMFALVADDELYLKTDAESQPAFEAAGLGPFEWTSPKTGQVTRMSYWRAPEAMLDNPSVAAEWSERAWAAACRARAAKKGR